MNSPRGWRRDLPGTAQYRLRGEVGGVVRAYPVAAGDNGIGSMSGNAIVLPVRGVSRRHALVTLGDDGLVLEDMGSKNGTLANGVRIQRTRLRPGDEVRVGPVTLRVEAVEADDAALAISLDGGSFETVGLPAHDTTAVATDQVQRPGLGAVEGLLKHLLARPGGDLHGALGLLLRETGARGACLFTQPARRARVAGHERGRARSRRPHGSSGGRPPGRGDERLARRHQGRRSQPALRLRGNGRGNARLVPGRRAAGGRRPIGLMRIALLVLQRVVRREGLTCGPRAPEPSAGAPRRPRRLRGGRLRRP